MSSEGHLEALDEGGPSSMHKDLAFLRVRGIYVFGKDFADTCDTVRTRPQWIGRGWRRVHCESLQAWVAAVEVSPVDLWRRSDG